MVVEKKPELKIPQNWYLVLPTAYRQRIFIRQATQVLDNKPNTTIVIELNGIRIAAITGDRAPCTAKLSPITLYIKARL